MLERSEERETETETEREREERERRERPRETDRETERETERQRERLTDNLPQERVSISVGNNAGRYQIGKPQGETVSKDTGSTTSAVYTNMFPHRRIKY